MAKTDKQLEEELSNSLNEFEKRKGLESVEKLIAEDTNLVQDILESNSNLKGLVTKVISANNQLLRENDAMRVYLTTVRKNQLIATFKEDAKKIGMMKE